jgi:hypothetical protein
LEQRRNASGLESRLICPIYQKGDPLEWKNYRGITLANVRYKKLDPIVRESVGKYKCGFIAGKSASGHILNLRKIMEKKKIRIWN